jgi:hypothetical protein
VQKSDYRRAIVGGGAVTLIASVTEAHLWDPPILGFALIFSAGAIGTALVIAIRAISTRNYHRKPSS